MQNRFTLIQPTLVSIGATPRAVRMAVTDQSATPVATCTAPPYQTLTIDPRWRAGLDRLEKTKPGGA